MKRNGENLRNEGMKNHILAKVGLRRSTQQGII